MHGDAQGTVLASFELPSRHLAGPTFLDCGLVPTTTQPFSY